MNKILQIVPSAS